MSPPADQELPGGEACVPLHWSWAVFLLHTLEFHDSRAISTSSPFTMSFEFQDASFLLSTSRVSPGAPVESVYSKVRHFEGETLSVQCSYKSRKNHTEGKVWCKIRRKKCETVFTRVGVQGPRYLLQDDTQAKVVSITMAALRRQDSGRYWCMRNSSGVLYPLMGFLLEVSPGEQACWGTGMLGGCPPRPVLHWHQI